MHNEECPKMQELERRLVVAVKDEYKAVGNAIPAAKKAEREAVRAFENHIQEHKCLPPRLVQHT